MRWEDVKIYKVSKDKKDRLGNTLPYTLDKEARRIKARLTQWTSEDIELYGRDLTSNTRKMLTPARCITQDMVVDIAGTKYQIERIEYLQRFTFLIIKEWSIWQTSK